MNGLNVQWLRKFNTEESVESGVVLLVGQLDLVGSHLRSVPEPDRGEPPPSQRVDQPALVGHDVDEGDGGQDDLLVRLELVAPRLELPQLPPSQVRPQPVEICPGLSSSGGGGGGGVLVVVVVALDLPLQVLQHPVGLSPDQSVPELSTPLLALLWFFTA